MKPLLRPPLLLLMALAMPCCGGGHHASASPTSPLLGCEGVAGLDTYAANLSTAGSAGLFTFVLQSATPAPPHQGNNSWQLQVRDPQGKAVTGLSLTVKPFMPQHGHGSSVVPTVTASGDGYQITNLYLFMSGAWAITLTATQGDRSDVGVFNLCIP